MAVVVALLVLALLLPIMLAFATLADTELAIAANQLRASQARALADSGFEYALRGLSDALRPGGPVALLARPVAAAPLDGQSFIAVGGTGGFTVRATEHASGDPQVRTITAIGWTPTDSATDPRTKAHRQLTADVVAVPHPGVRAPCALCVRGALSITGNVAINGANADSACGADAKYGTFTRDATTVDSRVVISGGAGPSAQNRPGSDFDPVTFSPAVLDALKALARRNGTYFGPGFPRGGRVADGQTTWGGRVAFDASNRLPDGIVFVDTTDGRSIDPNAPAFPTLASATLGEGAFASPDGVFRGWIVVNGSLEITAGLAIRGLAYARDGFAYRAGGAGSIEGLAIALNIQNLTGARLEAADGGGLALTFDCQYAGGADLVPHGFALIRGTYREAAD